MESQYIIASKANDVSSLDLSWNQGVSNPEGGCGESIGDTRVEVIPENNDKSKDQVANTSY